MHDSVPLSSLTLPGTHDSMALYGWPVAQCQDLATPLAVQLQSGIRVLDIRLSVKAEGLMAYHGLYPQRVSFQHILKTIHAFLTAPESCRETLVMSIKQEDFIDVKPSIFSERVRDEINKSVGGMDMWFLENRIPTLGEVRGKVVMFSRFGVDGRAWKGGLEGMGIHPLTWPDSKKHGFTWDCKNTLVRTHDWYNIPSFLSIPEKVDLATRLLLPPRNDLPTPTLSITFFSAASPLSLPPTVARGLGWPHLGFGIEGVNSRVGTWLLELLGGAHEPRIRGWAFMDFYTYPEDNAIVPLLVECNFRGRVGGQEGWPYIL
ncbi:PLC-like phosphodiesterase [Cristinia sonorae]|uniref:PLC-like phosphodiesterase n=1 Tax=Cristinia sonorae TaxID=1940300 RepID=A0A8K0XU19_9AGAR|nr:PLC-like phosphodiesterase [Cristinia sonorae]